jgi:hypothetical protein
MSPVKLNSADKRRQLNVSEQARAFVCAAILARDLGLTKAAALFAVKNTAAVIQLSEAAAALKENEVKQYTIDQLIEDAWL